MTQTNITQASSSVTQIEEWQSRTLAELTQHIIAKHHTYLRDELPVIEALLNAPVQSRSNVNAAPVTALARIFHQFRREMEEHMKKEEAILFPMIEKLETARACDREVPRLPFGSIAHPIAVMEQEHERARKELAEIRTFTSDYEKIPGAAEEQVSVLERLKALDHDMEIHSRLEDEVLFPRAIRFERV